MVGHKFRTETMKFPSIPLFCSAQSTAPRRPLNFAVPLLSDEEAPTKVQHDMARLLGEISKERKARVWESGQGWCYFGGNKNGIASRNGIFRIYGTTVF